MSGSPGLLSTFTRCFCRPNRLMIVWQPFGLRPRICTSDSVACQRIVCLTLCSVRICALIRIIWTDFHPDRRRSRLCPALIDANVCARHQGILGEDSLMSARPALFHLAPSPLKIGGVSLASNLQEACSSYRRPSLSPNGRG